jgi:hypothetical protein
MILTLFEIGAVATVAIYLVCWQVGVRGRRKVAWETLVAHLQPKRADAEFGHDANLNVDLFATPEERWRSINGAQGLWAMYENAGVMLDIANYAATNNTEADPELITALRRDVFQIRVCVMVALSKYACNQLNEATFATVSRATAYYVDMVKRTAELAQGNGRALAPGFVASM